MTNAASIVADADKHFFQNEYTPKRHLRLPVPVCHKQGECLLSLLTRAAVGNGYHHVADLLEGAGVEYGKISFVPFSLKHGFDRLGALLGVTDDTIRNLTHPQIEQTDKEGMIDWYGTPLRRQYVEARTRRYSPNTLKRHGFVVAEWMIRPLPFCPLSMEYLADVCPECGFELHWGLTKGLHMCERCGHTLLKSLPGRVPWKLREDLRQLASLVAPEKARRDVAISRLPARFAQWEGGAIFDAVIEISRLLACIRKKEDHLAYSKMRTDYSYETPEILAQAYRFLFDWEYFLSTIVGEIIEMSRSRDSGATGFDGLLGPVASIVRRRESSPSPFVVLLRSTLPAELRARGIPIYRNCVPTLADAAREGYISALELENELGLCRKLSRRLDKNSASFVECTTGKTTIRLYHRAAVRRSIEAWRASEEAVSVAKCLGVPAYVVKSLSEIGLLVQETDRDAILLANGKELFSRASVDRFKMLLAERIRDSSVPAGACSVLQGMGERRYEPEVWAKVLEEIVGGRLTVWLKDSGDDHLMKNFVAAPSDLNFVLSSIPCTLPPDVGVCCVTAAMVLGCQYAFAAQAVSQGVISSERNGKTFVIPLRALHKFQIDHVWGTRLGSDFREVRPLLFQAGLKPVAMLAKTYVWKRQEVKRVMAI